LLPPPDSIGDSAYISVIATVTVLAGSARKKIATWSGKRGIELISAEAVAEKLFGDVQIGDIFRLE
jgi:hypothetical protein